MGQSSRRSPLLTPVQLQAFKLSVSAACRKMTADQILDLADHLHAIIRKRGARYGAAATASFAERPGQASPERGLMI